MAHPLGSRRWRFREGLCAFLSLIPVLGSFGFFYMRHRSGRKQYGKLGIMYAALSGIGVLIVLLWASQVTWYVGNLFDSFEALCDDLRLGRFYDHILLIIPVIIYISCIAHTLVARRDYLRYMEQVVLPYQTQPTLLSDRKWRRNNLLWTAMAFVPVFNGLALHFCGRRMERKRLVQTGMVFVAAAMLLFALRQILYEFYWITFSEAVMDIPRGRFWLTLTSISKGSVIAWVFSVILYGVCILLVFMLREDYLAAAARRWVADTQEHPYYADERWRRANSGWQIWTLIPIIGGVGLIRAGISANIQKLKKAGIVFLVISLLVQTATLFGIMGYNSAAAEWMDTGGSIDTYRVLAMIFLLLVRGPEYIFSILGIFTIYIGCLARREVLLGRAAAFGEHASEIDQEIALQTQYRNRARKVSAAAPKKTIEQTESSQKTPHREDIPKPAAVTEIPQNPAQDVVDINTCTQAELTSLPGISLAEAKRALQYRQERGGFSSVDEFVDVLEIKPHFAVQIFKMATASQKRPEKAAAERGHRRSIDL